MFAPQEIFAQRFIALWSWRKTIQQSAQIKAGTTDQDGNPFSAGDFQQNFFRRGRVVARRKQLGGLQEIDEVMRDSAPLRFGHLCRSDIKALVNLHRIAVYDFTPQLLGEPKRKLAFTGTCWAEYDHERAQVVFFQIALV